MSAANDYSTLVKREAEAETALTEGTGVNTREYILSQADALINGDRNTTYGDPTEDFQRTADYWNIHLKGILSRKVGKSINDLPLHLRMVLDDLIDTWDVAIMMTLLKTSRLSWSPQKEDHWIDTAGYAACGAECVQQHFGTVVPE